MSILSISQGLYQINSMCSVMRAYKSPPLNEGMELIKSGTILGVKAYNISEKQKTPMHILISIFTFGIFAIIKAIQLACVKNSCIQKLKLGLKKIDVAVLTGTSYVGIIAQLINPIIDVVKNI